MIRSNVFYNFIFAQPDYQSVYEAGRTLRLPVEGDSLLVALEPGHCIHFGVPSSMPIAILMKVDHVPPARNLQNVTYDRHTTVAGRRLHQAPAIQAMLDRLKPPDTKSGTSAAAGDKTESLLPEARKLLNLAALHPHYPVARCWDQADTIPPPQMQKRIWQQLERLKLAVFCEPRLGSHNQLLIELTEAGWQLIGGKAPKPGAGGNMDHRQPCHWIRMHFEQAGRQVQLEWTVPGTTHRTDVAVAREDGKWDSAEYVATSFDNLPDHILASFEQTTVIATVTIVAAQKQIVTRIGQQLRADSRVLPYLDRVKFDVIDNYMKGIFR